MNKSNRIIPAGLLIIAAIVLLRNAWISDDAYITMRTVDNFIHGFGLTWNVGERVQCYTHPLWMFILSGFYAFTRDAYFTPLLISILVSLLAIAVLFAIFPNSPLEIMLGWSILFLSKSFVDYSVSGLENPATHLLAVLFLLIFFRVDHKDSGRDFFWLSFLSSLILLNRIDAMLFFIPPLIYVYLERRSLRSLRVLLAGLAPFIVWELFSLAYYGFLFPNTAYAKLNTGIPLKDLVEQGILYFLNSIAIDPITLSIVGIGVLLGLAQTEWRERSIALGIIIYLVYILYIGGDFMSGRFFALPLLLSVVLFLVILRKQSRPREKMAALALVIILGMASPMSPLFQFSNTDTQVVIADNGIADEKSIYYSASGLLMKQRNLSLPQHRWRELGEQLKAEDVKVVELGGVGFVGFFSGPTVHILDKYALCDPLLARLPDLKYHNDWRIGHFRRNVPAGYLKTLETGQMNIEDLSLAKYYEKLSLIIRGNIWSPQRWSAILGMNTGRYNYLIDQYMQNNK